jgi:type IV pilus assembly protein PilV
MQATSLRQQGVGLIEVLISVLILGIGLLGIAAMQATALRNSQGSFERSQAVIQSYSILDAMRANRNAALAGEYALGGGMICEVPASTSLAAADMNRWITSLKNTLGSGVDSDETTCGQVVCTAAGECTVTVQWDDSRATQANESGARVQGDEERQESTVTVI